MEFGKTIWASRYALPKSRLVQPPSDSNVSAGTSSGSNVPAGSREAAVDSPVQCPVCNSKWHPGANLCLNHQCQEALNLAAINTHVAKLIDDRARERYLQMKYKISVDTFRSAFTYGHKWSEEGHLERIAKPKVQASRGGFAAAAAIAPRRQDSTLNIAAPEDVEDRKEHWTNKYWAAKVKRAREDRLGDRTWDGHVHRYDNDGDYRGVSIRNGWPRIIRFVNDKADNYGLPMEDECIKSKGLDAVETDYTPKLKEAQLLAMRSRGVIPVGPPEGKGSGKAASSGLNIPGAAASGSGSNVPGPMTPAVAAAALEGESGRWRRPRPDWEGGKGKGQKGDKRGRWWSTHQEWYGRQW